MRDHDGEEGRCSWMDLPGWEEATTITREIPGGIELAFIQDNCTMAISIWENGHQRITIKQEGEKVETFDQPREMQDEAHANKIIVALREGRF